MGLVAHENHLLLTSLDAHLLDWSDYKVHRQSRGTKLFSKKKLFILPKYSRSNITMISLRDRASSPQLEEYGARMARLMQAPRWGKKSHFVCGIF